MSDYGVRTVLLAKGGYGEIYSTSKGFVHKVIPNYIYGIIPEINIPMSLDHPGIIKYHDIKYENGNVIIVMDAYPGNLRKLPIVSSGNVEIFKSFAFQLITTVAYLTSHNIIHRDIKPDNILYNDDLKLILIDFGLSTPKECLLDINSKTAYSLIYRPPEILASARNTYTAKADVWALGCVLYEIYTLEFLFQQNTPEELLDAISSMPTTLVDNPEINDLLIRMLDQNPNTRESIFALQMHPLFNDFTEGRIAPTTCIDRVVMDRNPFTYNVPESISAYIVWMLTVKMHLNMNNTVFHIAVHAFLRYMSTYSKKLLLCAVSSLMLALDFIRDTRCEYNLAELIDRKFKMILEDVTKRQHKINVAIGYDLHVSTPHDEIMKYRHQYPIEVITLASNILTAASYLVSQYNITTAYLCLEIAHSPLTHEGRELLLNIKSAYTDYTDLLTSIVDIDALLI